MNLLAEPLVIVWLRVNQGIERVYNLTTAYNHQAHAAYGSIVSERRLELYDEEMDFCRELAEPCAPYMPSGPALIEEDLDPRTLFILGEVYHFTCANRNSFLFLQRNPTDH